VLLAFALRCGRTVLAVLPTILPMALPSLYFTPFFAK